MKQFFYSLLLASILAGIVASEVVEDGTITVNDNSYTVETTLGLISVGAVKKVKISNVEKKVKEFLGIPYAEPPIDDKRFTKPTPKAPWNSTVFAADTMPNRCIQPKGIHLAQKVNSSEDCLYMNIWSPDGAIENAKANPNKSLPVMVWLHGGGFLLGSVETVSGAVLAAAEDVVVVALNYRLGIFGFLATDNKVIKGNYGLLDQQLALKWIKDNALAFGGDAQRITLFGNNAGAASVNLHMLNPQSRAYFKRGIMQSGSALARWVVPHNLAAYQKVVREFVFKELKCEPKTANDFEDVLECLQNLDAHTIAAKPLPIEQVSFVPVVDGDFIDIHPLIENAWLGYNNKEVLMGVTQKEGAAMILGLFTKEKFDFLSDEALKKNVTASAFNAFIDKYFVSWPQWPSTLTSTGLQAMKNNLKPFSNPDDGLLNADALSGHFGRDMIVCAQNTAADSYMANNNKVYYYKFSYRPSYTVWPQWMGATQGDELSFVFGDALLKAKATSAEKQLSARMMKHWASFARDGRPGVEWQFMSKEMKEYLEYLPSAGTTVVRTGGVERQRCGFLQLQLPFVDRLQQPVDPTFSPSPPATPSPSQKQCADLSKTATIVVAVLAAALGVAIIVIVWLIVRRKKYGSAHNSFAMS